MVYVAERHSYKSEMIYIPIIAIVLFSLGISTVYALSHIWRRKQQLQSKCLVDCTSIIDNCDNEPSVEMAAVSDQLEHNVTHTLV